MAAPPVQDQPIIISGESVSPDLWNKALGTLSVELRNSLDLTKASRGYVLSEALKEAQEKRQTCAQKFWTLKKRNGETIILRDVIEKIIVWVEKFIAVGDAAVQYDTAHAAPAWAAFRFVLQMAVNDKRAFGETIENLEAVAHLITRYAILEELYLQRYSTARDKLEDIVICLYAEILTFLARCRKYFQSSAKIRLAKSVVKLSEDEQMAKIRTIDSQVSRLTEVFSVDIQTETAKRIASMNTLLTSLNEPIKRLLDHSSISTQLLQESQRLQLLHWLSPVPFSSHHKRHSESRIPGSGQWLLDHNRYRNWRNTSSSSIFLLHGIIGSGKTSLTSTVVDSFLQESSGQASPAPVAYFYCTRNSAETERSNPDEILRSILRQLTVSHGSSSQIHERVLQEYERRQAVAKVDGFEITRLKAAECVRLILDTTATNPATVVIDAVDEIEPNSRHVLLNALVQIVQSSMSVVKVFVTSRDDSKIHALLPDAEALRVKTEHTRVDMYTFVREEVSSAIRNRRMLNGVVSDTLKEDLISVLVAGAGEMFLWTVRQIENLCRLKTEADIRSRMRALPKNTLNELYEENWTQISESGQRARSYAIQVFSMLLCAQEALSPEALIQALAKTVSQQGETMTLAKMMDICLNLIVLDSELNVLRFAHISFQEFLETRVEFAPHYVHRVAAEICLDLCLEGLPRGMESNLSPKDNFHHYSAVYWAEHCKITVITGSDDSLNSKMVEFVFDGGDVALAFVDWIQEVKKFTKKLPNHHALAKALYSVIHSGASPLFTACVFGLAPIIDDLAHATDYDWNQTNDFGQSGLYLAAAAGRRTIVQSLLQHKAFVNILGGKFGHPLHAACFGGHTSIVELLLDHGADPKLGPRSALEYALLADQENIALLLLDGKFDVSDQAQYDSILQQAAEAGFADVVQFLQKQYASLYGDLGSSRCRAVEVAIFRGRTGVIERYMQKLSNPESDIPADAIATAALGGQDSMIRFLVDKGLDLNHEGVFGTPLRAASVMGHESTVRLLLGLGANLHVPGSFGEPLQAAAMRGHESITRTLLSHGANVNSESGLYGTALQAAAHRGHQNVVEILLDAGADVHRDGFSRDAFHAASEGGHEGIVRLMLERGFQVRHTLGQVIYCPAVNTPRDILRDASPSRFQDEKLVQGPQPGSKDWRERASMVDSSLVVGKMRGAVTSELEMIQPYRQGFGYQSERENYALRAAAAKGHATVVKLLLSQLDKVGIIESEVVVAFIEACGNGHVNVVNQFLSDPVEVKGLKAALEAAASNGHLTVVNLLIDHEARLGLARVETVEMRTNGTYELDSTARAILNSGSKGGHLPILQRGQDLVAQRCTDVASRHLYGEALTTAVANRKVDVVEALLEDNFELDLEELTNTLNSVCAWGSEEALQILLKHDAKKVLGVQQYSSGLTRAAGKNNRQIVMYWLNQHPERLNLVVDPATLIDVSGNGYIDVLLPLIEKFMPADSFETTLNQCLRVASENGHKEVVEYLIGEGADVNSIEQEPLYTSDDTNPDQDYFNRLVYEFNRLTRKLTALQAALIGFERFSPNTENTPLQQLRSSWKKADASSQQQVIEVLLEKGADPNGGDEYEGYPLNIAAKHCTVEIVQKLISSGAKVGAVTKEHGTALQAAARREIGGLPVIKTLLEADAPVSSIDPGKTVALNDALSFFETLGRTGRKGNGKFVQSTSIADVLNTGPGAVVKLLLANLPDAKADDSRYGLLAQMACMAGDQGCVELLLQRGMDVNISGSYYGTALQAASRVGNIKIVERLLNSGADVNVLQGVYGTALRAAVIGGHEGLVRILITRGADVNLRYKDKDESVLHLALRSRHSAVFKSLLAAGADTNPEFLDRLHILVLACKHGIPAFVELLLVSGVDVNVTGTKPLSYKEATILNAACAGGHPSVVKLLLNHGADMEKSNESSATPLIAAIRGNNLSAVLLLLDAGADVNHAVDVSHQVDVRRRVGVSHQAVDVTPLSEAAEDCKIEIVEELLSAGATIGSAPTKENALARACSSGQHMVIELLLKTLSGTPYEAEICGEALSKAIECRNDKIVRRLLEYGVAPSFKMLRLACSAGALEVVRMLVDKGIDINEDDGDDAPLLHVAASHLRPDVVQFLINRGTNVMLCSTKYGSPLIAALEGYMAPSLRSYSQPESCRSLANQLPLPESELRRLGRFSQEEPGYKEFLQCEEIVRILFSAGAEVGTTIRNFGNALHLASYIGSEDILHQLLQRTEDVNILGGYFESPLIAALVGDHPIAVELLLDRSIDINRSSPGYGSALRYACAHSSKQIVQSLLDHGADVNAYNDKYGSALAAATSPDTYSKRGDEATRSIEEQRAIVELLLRHEPRIQIRECDLLAAASGRYRSDGPHYMRLFLQHDQSVVATEAVINLAIQKYNDHWVGSRETLRLLLNRNCGFVITPATLEAAKLNKAIDILLEFDPTLDTTQEARKGGLGTRWKRTREVMKVLICFGKPRVRGQEYEDFEGETLVRD